MDDIYIYTIALPPGVHEMVAPCFGGYTVYLSSLDTAERQEKAYNHVIKHIKRGDYEKTDVQAIESEAHK